MRKNNIMIYDFFSRVFEFFGVIGSYIVRGSRVLFEISGLERVLEKYL